MEKKMETFVVSMGFKVQGSLAQLLPKVEKWLFETSTALSSKPQLLYMSHKLNS